MNNSAKSTESSRSVFCVLNIGSLYKTDNTDETENTKKLRKLFGDLTPEDIVEKAIEIWCRNKPQRTCAINYEKGDTGNEHIHMVLEDPAKFRFSAVMKLFPGIHIEPTRGSKAQAEDYINKVCRFAEKGHTIIVPARYRGESPTRKKKRPSCYRGID